MLTSIGKQDGHSCAEKAGRTLVLGDQVYTATIVQKKCHLRQSVESLSYSWKEVLYSVYWTEQKTLHLSVLKVLVSESQARNTKSRS